MIFLLCPFSLHTWHFSTSYTTFKNKPLLNLPRVILNLHYFLFPAKSLTNILSFPKCCWLLPVRGCLISQGTMLFLSSCWVTLPHCWWHLPILLRLIFTHPSRLSSRSHLWAPIMSSFPPHWLWILSFTYISSNKLYIYLFWLVSKVSSSRVEILSFPSSCNSGSHSSHNTVY